MTSVYGILSLLLSIVGALYLQIPTFILTAGYGWSHNYPVKRWALRISALFAFILFVNAHPPLCSIMLISIPFAFFWIFSLFNANSNLFIALDERQIIKQKDFIYPGDKEVVGYADENNNAICYPVNEMVMPRHLLNDVFCNNPLFVSYCAACRSTMIYDPVIDGQRLTFEVLGVHRRNMIIRDHQTGTVWQQATGEGMYGKLKGKQLEYYAYQQTTLEDWLKQYPVSYIAKESDNIRKGLVSKNILMKILKKVTQSFIAPGKTDITGFPSREKIWGLQLNGKSKAYPVSELKKVTEITDYVDGREIYIRYSPGSNQIEGIDSTTNEPLKFQDHWWLGWKEFHPDTEIWKAQIQSHKT